MCGSTRPGCNPVRAVREARTVPLEDEGEDEFEDEREDEDEFEDGRGLGRARSKFADLPPPTGPGKPATLLPGVVIPWLFPMPRGSGSSHG